MGMTLLVGRGLFSQVHTANVEDGDGQGTCVSYSRFALLRRLAAFKHNSDARVPGGASEGAEQRYVAVGEKKMAEQETEGDAFSPDVLAGAGVSVAELEDATRMVDDALPRMRTESIHADELFQDSPVMGILCDEPVHALVIESDPPAAWYVRLFELIKLKLVLDAYVVFLSAVFLISAFYKRYVTYPAEDDDNVTHHDPIVAIVDRICTSLPTIMATGLMMWAMFGKRASRGLWIALVSTFIALVLYAPVEFLILPPEVRRPFFVLYFAMYVSAGLIVARATQRLVNDRVLRRVAVPQFIAVIVYTIYSLLIPSIWSFMTNDLQRGIFRIVVHPIIFELAMFSVRAGARSSLHSDPRRAYLTLISLQMLNANYGRFLVAATDDSRSTIIISVVLALQEVLLRLSVGARDRFFFKLFNRNKAPELFFKTPRAMRLRGELVCQDQICENVGIVCSAIAVIMYRVEVSGKVLTIERVLRDVATQLAIEYVTDISVMWAELRLRVPIFSSWKMRHGSPLHHFGYFSYFGILTLIYFQNTFFGVRGFMSASS